LKPIENLILVDTVKYSRAHTWARVEDETIVVGISDYAQDQLGEIIFIELPLVGDRFDVDAVFGVVESTKSVSDLYMPVGGEIVAVNESLVDSPEQVNSAPYTGGWMIGVKTEDQAPGEALLSVESYRKMLLQSG
jgi:glycine cleavage system H protein